MKHFYVITPEFDYVEPILDDGSGPTYQACDVVEIEAENKKDAVSLGVKYMLSKSPREFPWVHDQRSDNLCPYTGVKVEEKV